jgi:hypothetical protein
MSCSLGKGPTYNSTRLRDGQKALNLMALMIKPWLNEAVLWYIAFF